MIREHKKVDFIKTKRPLTQSKKFDLIKSDFNYFTKFQNFEQKTRALSARSHKNKAKNDFLTMTRSRSVSPVPGSPSGNYELHTKKIYKIYLKIVVQLELLKNISKNKRNETENISDLSRQLQRADEFSIRFSRNNLYETKRILGDIKKVMIPYALERLSRHELKQIGKKMVLGYQAASQSLQYYINYVKNPANLEVPEKISELVILIAEFFLCSEHLCIPCGETNLQNDAVKICNELMSILKSKPPIGEYLHIKQQYLNEKKFKKPNDFYEIEKIKSLSMYKSKPPSKAKMMESRPGKKICLSSILGSKARKMKKHEEKKARITHEIYTQKMNPRRGKSFGNKLVKFDGSNAKECENVENSEEKKSLKKSKFFTPREVRSQDDDVETVVQTIEDDELPSLRIERQPLQESNEESDLNDFNKLNFRDLLLEAIQELQSADKQNQKSTLKKLLTSIQRFPKTQKNSPRPPMVKVYHFKHKESEQEEKDGEEREEKTKETINEKDKTDDETDKIEVKISENEKVTDLSALLQENKKKEEIVSGERRLNIIFQTMKQRKFEETEGELVPKGKIELNLKEELIEEINKYKKKFTDYMKSNIMYKKTSQAMKPWELVEKVSDFIILDIIKDIASDFQNDAILKRLYFNELLEVVN